MRILWIKPGGVWPLNVGGRLRSFHIISELSQRHRVTVLTTHQCDDDPDAAGKALPFCERVASFPYSAPKAGTPGFAAALARSWVSRFPVDLLKWRVPALRAEVEWLLGSNQADICVADFLYGAVNVPLDTSVPVVLFSHNVEHTIWKRLTENEHHLLKRGVLAIEWRKMRRSERDVCARSRSVIAVSAVDARALQDSAPEAVVKSIPTGVDTSYFTPNGTPKRESHLVFSGAMDWHPNEDAMLHFIREILPLVRLEVPDVTMTIVGRNPSRRLYDVANAASVRVTGTVDDVRPFIDEASVYVVPLRVGSGTRLKIFEALSMAKAVVSTSVGAEGLPVVPEEHYVRADNPADFSRAVVSLLQDAARRRALGIAGRELVQSRFSWHSVGRQFEEHCLQALRQA